MATTRRPLASVLAGGDYSIEEALRQPGRPAVCGGLRAENRNMFHLSDRQEDEESPGLHVTSNEMPNASMSQTNGSKGFSLCVCGNSTRNDQQTCTEPYNGPAHGRQISHEILIIIITVVLATAQN